MGAVYDAVSSVESEIGRPVNVTIRSPAEWDEADGAFERAVESGLTNRPDISTLDDLLNRGLIDAVEADPATAPQWLDDAGRHLDAAQKIAGLDPLAHTCSQTMPPEKRSRPP